MGSPVEDSSVFGCFWGSPLYFCCFRAGSVAFLGGGRQLEVFLENGSVFWKVAEFVGSCSIFCPRFQNSLLSRVLNAFRQKSGSRSGQERIIFELLTERGSTIFKESL